MLTHSLFSNCWLSPFSFSESLWFQLAIKSIKKDMLLLQWQKSHSSINIVTWHESNIKWIKRKIKKNEKGADVTRVRVCGLITYDMTWAFDNDIIYLQSSLYRHYPSCHLLSPTKFFCKIKCLKCHSFHKTTSSFVV